MGIRKSSGIINMKYKYKIKDESVTEFENGIYNGTWSFEVLKKDTPPSIFSFMGIDDSFDRTKKWLLQNYPEFFI